MSTPVETTWQIAPHTQAKHEILRRYLSAWFPILGSVHSKIVYLDGFCGPGRYLGGEPGSPVIAIETAAKYADRLSNREIIFLFLDSNADRISHLAAELGQIRKPGNFQVHVQQGEFEQELRRMLDDLDRRQVQIAPTFAFIDPFGFEGVPFDLVSRLLSNRSCEALLYFPVDSVNRWLEHPNPKTRQHITDLLGITNIQSIVQLPGNRVENLRILYQRQLGTVARFVRFFEMRNTRDRAIYYLFFASNHPLGHKKMKEAFWKVDPSGGYSFSDATNPDQLLLFEDDPAPQLAQSIQSQFSGSTIEVSEISTWVVNETPYLESHMKEALKKLEAAEIITVEPLKADGSKHRRNTFPPDAVVIFVK